MYCQAYMRQYYLEHKEKIKARARKWVKDNPGKIRIIQNSYKTKNQEVIRDYKEEKMEVLPFKKRVSKECLAQMKENSRINQKLIKYYEWPEDWIPRKKILEGG
jgi:hypothetical protein